MAIFNWPLPITATKRFCSNFLSVSQRLFIFSKCESALFIFFFQKTLSALALISGCKAHNFLIMPLIIFDILNMFLYQHYYVQNF
jgi:hypothetical protein